MDLFNTKKVKALEAMIVPLQQAVQRNFAISASRNLINQNVAEYAPWNLQRQTDRYSTTDDIYSIIRMIATTSAQIPIYAYLIQDEKSYKKIDYKSYAPIDIVKSKINETKALVDLQETDKCYQLMENPHLFLSKYEFYEAIYTMLPLQGEVILYKIRQFQYDEETGEPKNEGFPIKLEFLDLNNVVKHKSGFPETITSYDYRENGKIIMKGIPPEDVIHLRYFKGIGPLQVLSKRLVRVDSNMDASVAQLQNGGIPGIVYDKGDVGDAVAKGTNPDGSEYDMTISAKRKDNFYKYLTHKGNKGAPYFSSGELGYIALGLKYADMEAIELADIDFKKLCNAFMISDRLFNNDATGSEVSDDNANKSLYTRACLPMVMRVRDAFINQLIPDFNEDKKKRTLREDISEIPALQADMLHMANTVAALPYFIPNEVQQLFKFDKYDDPAADKMYIKTGYVAIEDLQGAGDLKLTEDYQD